MIEIRKLKAFVAVAEELNFHRAAERLNTVQPALSRLIKALEQEVGVALLTRTTRQVRLTAPGKSLLLDARGILTQVEAVVQTTREVAEGRTGTLTLAYMDFAVHRILPRLIADISQQAPGVRVLLTYMSTAQQRLALTEGRVDVGILIGNANNPQVDCRVVAREPVVVAMRKDHPLATLREIGLRQLLDEDIVLGTSADWSAFREIIYELYGREGRVPRIAHEASSAPAIMGLVAGGMGLSFYAGAPELYGGANVVFKPLRPRVPVEISLAWRRNGQVPIIKNVLRAAGLEK